MVARSGEGLSPQEGNNGITRRELIAGGIGAFIGGAAGSRMEAVVPSDEKMQEKIGRIIAYSNQVEEMIPDGMGVDYFWGKSGWDEYSREDYYEALRKINSKTHPDIDIMNLMQNDKLTALYKEEKE